jgi:hypothetical protein
VYYGQQHDRPGTWLSRILRGDPPHTPFEAGYLYVRVSQGG